MLAWEGLQHYGYGDLSESNQERVERLSALLRVADALDREHLQRVQCVDAAVRNGTVHLEATASGDLLLERWALERKGSMFEKVFGRGLELHHTDP